METQFTKKEYSHKQVSLLTKAMLIAGGFFIIIGLGSFGLSLAFKNVADGYYATRLWLPVFLLLLLGGMIVSMLMGGSMMKRKAGWLTALGFILYVGMMSTIFGYLFALLRARTNTDIYGAIAFGVTAVIFLLAAAFAKAASAKGIFTMGKFIGMTSIAMSIMMIIFLILGIIGVAARSPGTFLASNAIFNFIMIGMCLISFLYIIIDIWMIGKSGEFIEYAMGEEIPSSYVWYCGYKLLTDLINILIWVVLIIIRVSRRD